MATMSKQFRVQRSRAAQRRKPKNPYQQIRDEIMDKLEGIAQIRGPTPEEYKAALAEIRSDVDDWFDTSLMAVEDDIARSKKDDT